MKRLRLLPALMLWGTAPPASADTPWTLVRTYPHDPGAFTQGLIFLDGTLYESTGQPGASQIRQVRLKDGKVLRRTALEDRYFGEGLTHWGDRLISLTWRHREGFVWRTADFARLSTFRYEGEGWGLTQDGQQIVMSDGSADLRFLDPETLAERRRVTVTWNGRPVPLLNELEYARGEVLANIWYDRRIARIDPASGAVIDWIDLSPLAARVKVSNPDAVLNGIAYDPKGDRLFVTGKYWPSLFEIRLDRRTGESKDGGR